MLSFESGVKANVVPAKACALFEGLEGDDGGGAGRPRPEKDLGIRFAVSAEEGPLKDRGGGGKRTRLHAVEGEECLNRASGADRAVCRWRTAHSLRKVKCVKPADPPWGLAGSGTWASAQKDELSGELTLAFSILKITEDGACRRI